VDRWYADGLRFSCTQCGNCCSGPPGTVWVTAEEGQRIARRLGVDQGTFYERYARPVGKRWSLRERPFGDGLDCILLDRDRVPGRAVCSVYEDRPRQCRSWPFWPENLRSLRHWERARDRTPCPGMDQGRLYGVEEIRVMRDSTPKG
jgi:Fe-S-cluster containining protein